MQGSWAAGGWHAGQLGDGMQGSWAATVPPEKNTLRKTENGTECKRNMTSDVSEDADQLNRFWSALGLKDARASLGIQEPHATTCRQTVRALQLVAARRHPWEQTNRYTNTHAHAAGQCQRGVSRARVAIERTVRAAVVSARSRTSKSCSTAGQ
jgi:hypothetical protein